MSAPYGEGRPGTVFIYSGQNGSPIPVLSQTIVGSDLNLKESLLGGLTSFGAFIEGNTDIDGNCHNGGCLACMVTVMPWKHSLILSVDLVIGAFQSRKIFVLRYVRPSLSPCSLVHGQVCVVWWFMWWVCATVFPLQYCAPKSCHLRSLELQ